MKVYLGLLLVCALLQHVMCRSLKYKLETEQAIQELTQATDRLAQELNEAELLKKQNITTSAKMKVEQAEKEYEEISQQIMDILDRPENGGMMRALLQRARDMKAYKAHIESLAKALQVELKRAQERQEMFDRLQKMFPFAGILGI